jgi:hypothetical protein
MKDLTILASVVALAVLTPTLGWAFGRFMKLMTRKSADTDASITRPSVEPDNVPLGRPGIKVSK